MHSKYGVLGKNKSFHWRSKTLKPYKTEKLPQTSTLNTQKIAYINVKIVLYKTIYSKGDYSFPFK